MAFEIIPELALHYRVIGAEGAPRLVLLNSLGTDSRIWDDLTIKLGGRFRVLQYDQRGQGLSDAPPGPYSIADHAKDLLALLARLDWGPTVLCGLSIGGMIAMEALDRQPGLVRGLVLADTADRIGSPAFWEGRMGEIRSRGLGAIAEPVMQRWFGSSFRKEHGTEVRGWSNLLARAPVDGYLGSCAALRDADLTNAVDRITVPVLCLCGSEDASTPPPAVRSLATRIAGAEYAEISEAGHLTPVERPREFAEALIGFMEVCIGD